MNKQILVVLVNLILLTGCSGTSPELGVESGRLKPCPDTPNCVNSQSADDKHSIIPLHFTGPLREAQNHLLEIVESEKRMTIKTVQEDYIRVEARSAVFRFVDDIEFYFPDQPTAEKIIHVRSASRTGFSDFGVNRKRIERIRKRFEQVAQQH